MTHFLFVSHGHMASGLKSSLEIIVGSIANFSAIDAYVDETNISDKINDYFKDLPTADQLIMFSDIQGGSANQLLYQHINRPNTFLITGVNLPLVLQLVLLDKGELNIKKFKMY